MLVAFGLVALGTLLGVSQALNLVGKEVVTGRVTGLPAESDGDGGVTYKVEAEFHDHAGRPRYYRSSVSSSHPGFKRGDRIRIYFPRDNPDACGVVAFGYRFGMAWVLIGVGMFIIWMMVGFRAGNELLLRLVPDTIAPGLEVEAGPTRRSPGAVRRGHQHLHCKP